MNSITKFMVEHLEDELYIATAFVIVGFGALCFKLGSLDAGKVKP